MLRLLKLLPIFLAILLLTACAAAPVEEGGIAATTAPVAQFARAITEGTGLTVSQVIHDSVSCLHDYSLSVRQMELVEKSRVVLISGAGLEETLEDALASAETILDCSEGIVLKDMEGHDHDHGHEEHEHHHEDDPHIWLDPLRAAQMAENICIGLTALYPEYETTFRANTDALVLRLQELDAYGKTALSDLSCREIITFHDGFGYLADAYGLEIAAAIEEESGSEASAKTLTELVHLVEHHGLTCVFTEVNGSPSAASVISAETGVPSCALDMAMGGSDYFEAMKHNFDTLKEALQ